MGDDLYEIWTTIAQINFAANQRGGYRPEDLTRLEDLGLALARIAEQEMRGRSADVLLFPTQ